MINVAEPSCCHRPHASTQASRHAELHCSNGGCAHCHRASRGHARQSSCPQVRARQTNTSRKPCAGLSSPIFFGERPRGPIFGAREEAAPTSPPVARTYTSTTAEGSNLGGCAAQKGPNQLSHVQKMRQNIMRRQRQTQRSPSWPASGLSPCNLCTGKGSILERRPALSAKV